MRRPLRSNIRKPRHEVTQENIAFQFESLANEVPLRLTPRDDISKMGVKAYFSQSPMLLSPGMWSVYGLMGITSNNNIHIIGSGYHTIFRCGVRNTDGVLSITGNDVVIDGHFGGNLADNLILAYATRTDAVSAQHTAYTYWADARGYGDVGTSGDAPWRFGE